MFVHVFVSALTVVALSRHAFAGFAELAADAVGGPHRGSLAAFSDINNDKQVDVLLISGHAVTALVASAGSTQLGELTLITVDSNVSSIVSVVPADFDGDLKNDLLVVTRTAGNKLSCSVYFQNDNLVFGNAYSFEDPFVDEPLIVDYNGDMLPDMLAENATNHRTVYIAMTTRNFSVASFGRGKDPFLYPHANSFADWNGDRAADVILITEKNIEIWLNQNGFAAATLIGHTFGTSLGQTVMTDLDADGKIELIAIVSSNNSDSLLMWRSKTETSEVETIALDLTHNGSRWRFAAAAGSPARLVMGDYDNDGYPDAVAVLQDEATGTRYAVPIKNVPCQADAPRTCRTMSVAWELMLLSAPGATAAAFYDLLENGILDILVAADAPQQQPAPPTPSGGGHDQTVHVFQNDAKSFACFLKVMVVSGRCEGSCVSPRPFTNQPGPSVCYTSVYPDGAAATAVGAQLYQTAHSALLLPYVMFGLGETPNFIDTLTVGLPPSANQAKWSREWTMVIPNAYVVVLPQPPQDPSRWQQKLFIVPGRQMLITGLVLLALCALAAIIIGLLHLKENRDDRAEKRQESQRFHFNAL